MHSLKKREKKSTNCHWSCYYQILPNKKSAKYNPQVWLNYHQLQICQVFVRIEEKIQLKQCISCPFTVSFNRGLQCLFLRSTHPQRHTHLHTYRHTYACTHTHASQLCSSVMCKHCFKTIVISTEQLVILPNTQLCSLNRSEWTC